jgi:hypothetical protein
MISDKLERKEGRIKKEGDGTPRFGPEVPFRLKILRKEADKRNVG